MTTEPIADDVRTAGFADECRHQIERLRKHAANLRIRADMDDTAREQWERRLAELIDGPMRCDNCGKTMAEHDALAHCRPEHSDGPGC